MASASDPRSHAPEHPVNCPSCGLLNKPAARFCGGCGKAISGLPGGLSPSASAPATPTSLRLQAKKTPTAQLASLPAMQRARDGTELRWGDADTPVPPAVISPGAPASIPVAVSPVRPGHAVTVEYRINGGPVHQAIGLSEPRLTERTGVSFARSCRAYPTERWSSFLCCASPASRSLRASGSRPSVPGTRWAAARPGRDRGPIG